MNDRLRRRLALSVFAALAMSGASFATHAMPVELGAADPFDWALLSIGGSTVTVNNQSLIRDLGASGNDLGTASRSIGIQGRGKLQMSGSGYIAGSVLMGDRATLNITDGNTIGGDVYGRRLRGNPKGNTVHSVSEAAALDAAANAATYYAGYYRGLAPTDTSISEITGSTTLFAASGLNVLDLDKLVLGASEVLTLDSQSNDAGFVINVKGDLKLDSAKILLTGGLGFEDVLFNVGGKVSLSGGGNASILQGTVMALKKEIAVSPGLVQGSLIGKKITLTSSADLDTAPVPPPAPVPIPDSGLLLISGLALLALLRCRGMRALAQRMALV